MKTILERWGQSAARRHWLVIVLWLVAVVGLLLGRQFFGGELADDYTVPGSSSAQGADLLTKEFPQAGGYSGQLVFQAPAGKQVSASSSAVNQAVGNAAKLPHVLTATSPFAAANSPLVSKNGQIAYATIAFDVVPGSLDHSYLDQLDAALAPARAAGLTVEYGGGAGQIDDATDDRSSEAVGLALALVLLLIMFLSLAAAVIPLVSAIVGVLVGLSILALLANLFTLPTTAPTVATLLGLGVAIDYALFMVARHREGVDARQPILQAIGRAAATSGAAVVVAGSTVVVAILGLYLSGVPFVGALGGSSAIMVVVAMCAALTLVPALLGLVKRAVRAWGRRDESAAAPDHEHGLFARWGRAVSRHPWPYAAGATLLLLVFALPLLKIEFGQVDAGANPTSQTSRRAYDLLSEGFGPGANGPITVVVAVPQGQSSSDTQSMMNSLSQSLSKTEGVASVSPANVNPANTVAVMNATPTTAPQDDATTDTVRRIRDDVLPTVAATTYLTGTAQAVDFTDRIVQRLPLIIGAVVLLALILLTMAFRSLAIGIKAAVMNLLSVAASYGVLVAVFQWGWGSSFIGLDEKVPIPAFVPMFMFAVIFGLSMDYEVFLLSRVHEAYGQTGDARRSVAIGIGATARVITTAAAVMIVVFASFVLNDQPIVKMLAVGLAFSVLIDASVVRMILVPAVMSLLGDRAWWIPRWLDRILPRISLED
ncbi:RND superfamily putative drug exporter [Hamadaea flava]|uniref:MMPL family transporter n=1 Tax=Hamadaea flava TaxID=1742688 RepID=A0ABV8LRD5_9ACTN|nr:MMPL family transporter [Hamadaea flava]MCP2323070.1 RND superfamily putative drug exporter [Hamadaea flava]